MKIATSMSVLWDYSDDIDRAVARLAAGGLEALDLDGFDTMKAWRGPLGDEQVARLRAASDRHGLPFVQAHGPMYDYYGPDAEEHLADTFRCIEWCGLLGVPWMVMHAYMPEGVDSPAHRQHCLDINLEYFRQFFPALEKHQVGIAIENSSDFWGRKRRYSSVSGDLITLCDALDHELIGLCWDTGHAQLQKLDQEAAISSMGARLKAIHVQDNDGLSDAHILPFHGKIDWNAVVAGLKGAGYQGPWTFEVGNAIRPLPDPLRDDAIRLMGSIGRHFTAQFA